MDDHISISRGEWSDYLALERFHYRAAAPATKVRILTACEGELLAGVLVISMPTLNGRWRDLAWPGEKPADRRRSMRWINREVRCISRVIVEPRFRGRSIARRLVKAYLRSPDSRKTEAVAAMGAFCPFFKAAGMREVKLAPVERDRALDRALRRAGLVALDCADLSRVRRAVRRSGTLRRKIVRWAGASRATSAWCERLDTERLAELACLAGSTIAHPRRVFVFP